MKYSLIKNGHELIRRDFENVPGGDWIPFVETEKPAMSDGQSCSEAAPVIQDGEARQVWVVVDQVDVDPVRVGATGIQEVPAWRIHAMLDRTGLKNTVAAMLEALPEPAKFDAKAQFTFATKFEADNPFVRAAAAKLGLSVQEFFQEALTTPGSEVADLTDPGLIDRIKAWWNT